jgi:PucR C-terminal helix-turn-helix domain
MQGARRLESNRPDGDREAEDRTSSASRSTPLTIVSGAIAGDDLERVAGSASEGLGRPIAIALPAFGPPVVSPAGAIVGDELRRIVDYAAAAVTGAGDGEPDAPAGHAVPVRMGGEVIGVVVAQDGVNCLVAGEEADQERAWLEATAAAAAVATLVRRAQTRDSEESRRALVRALRTGPPSDIKAVVSGARRLGLDLSRGAMAICAARLAETQINIPSEPGTLLAEVDDGLVLGVVSEAAAAGLAGELAARGVRVGLSAARRDPATLHEALREAELLVELPVSGQEETYRLLIGVLLRTPDELELLRAQTISPLAAYDAEHETDLLETLEMFLAHHGSTTDTAEAMKLHRHTVGYRLSRVQEVSGLSPYESDGRERLSLGLKAHQILEADKRRSLRL